MANSEVRNNHTIMGNEEAGAVIIADEVIATIAAMAVSEVQGIASVGGSLTSEVMSMLGKSRLPKGIKVEVNEDIVNLDISLSLEYGFPIPQTCGKVQQKVKATIENMTGLTVGDINTHVVGVNMKTEE